MPNVKAAPLSAMKGTPLDVDAIRSELTPWVSSNNTKNISIAIASVTVNGKTDYYLSVSGKSWRGDAPNMVNINGINYKVIREDNGSLGTVKGQDNYNHAEMKLASHINSIYGGTNAKIDIAVQNTSDRIAGACPYCSGKKGETPVSKLGGMNPNMNVTIYHGTTGVNP